MGQPQYINANTLAAHSQYDVLDNAFLPGLVTQSSSQAINSQLTPSAFRPLDDPGTTVDEQVVCTGTFSDPEPGAVYFGGDFYQGSFNDGGNYCTAISGASKMSIINAETTPLANTSQADALYQTIDSGTSWTSPGNQSVVDQLSQMLNGLNIQNPGPGADASAGMTELGKAVGVCLEVAAGGAGLAFAYAQKPTGYAMGSAVSMSIGVAIAGIANLQSCFSNFGPLDANENAALSIVGQSYQKTFSTYEGVTGPHAISTVSKSATHLDSQPSHHPLPYTTHVV